MKAEVSSIIRKVTSSLRVLGLLLSEEASEGHNVGVDLLGLVHLVTVGSHCV